MIERELARRWFIVSTLKELADEDLMLFFRDCMMHQADPDKVWDYMEELRADWMDDLNIGFIDEAPEEE